MHLNLSVMQFDNKSSLIEFDVNTKACSKSNANIYNVPNSMQLIGLLLITACQIDLNWISVSIVRFGLELQTADEIAVICILSFGIT